IDALKNNSGYMQAEGIEEAHAELEAVDVDPRLEPAQRHLLAAFKAAAEAARAAAEGDFRAIDLTADYIREMDEFGKELDAICPATQ
ncbi:MAG: hypothetical protein J7M17_09200, partial [Anaerolineae bacterium]|nr:hypothetical protein [Anaerolineae bacterium]